MMRRDETAGIKRVLAWEVAGVMKRGRPRMGWMEQVQQDISRAGLQQDDFMDRDVWRWEVCCFSS